VDATNPVVFVRAKDLGLAGTETPQEIDADRALSARLEAIRVEAAKRMGIPGSAAVPKIAMVAPPTAFTALDGVRHAADTVDLITRVISMGNCHRAVALTVAMCLGVAARLDGAVGRFWLWFFFRSVDVRHPERVPGDGPVLLCINHPNNFIDSLLVAGAIPRKVHYLATAALFKNRFVARFLLACGAIPVYRKQD